MSNYCLTHGSFTESDLTSGINAEGCMIVSCPPPVEFELDGWEWTLGLPEPSALELAQMNASAEELRLQFEGE